VVNLDGIRLADYQLRNIPRAGGAQLEFARLCISVIGDYAHRLDSF
jgi:hypothetical protein